MDLQSRNQSLESHVTRKLSRVVRRGVVGKVLRITRNNSLASYPTACPVRRRLVGLILPNVITRSRCWGEVFLGRVIPTFYPMEFSLKNAPERGRCGQTWMPTGNQAVMCRSR